MIRTVIVLLGILSLFTAVTQAQGIVDRCPSAIQPRPFDYDGEGIILTAFDGESLWVYDIERDTRYPLPQTRPCTTNCHLAPHAQALIYMDPETYVFGQMRLDGTQRTPIIGNVANVSWWSDDTFIIWTSDQQAFLASASNLNQNREILPSEGVIAIQPNGYLAVRLLTTPDGFRRAVVNLQDENISPVLISPDTPYFNAVAWSNDGAYLAYVGRGAMDNEMSIAGAELFLLRPGNAIPSQATFLSSTYGAVRINGYAPWTLAWSPDNTRLAFWVSELTGNDPEATVGDAVIHVLDVTTGEMVRYCAFATSDHTPNPPQLIWSPDGQSIAFAGNVPGDDKGYLLIALNVETGVMVELSNGIFPALGRADVYIWGIAP